MQDGRDVGVKTIQERKKRREGRERRDSRREGREERTSVVAAVVSISTLSFALYVVPGLRVSPMGPVPSWGALAGAFLPAASRYFPSEVFLLLVVEDLLVHLVSFRSLLNLD